MSGLPTQATPIEHLIQDNSHGTLAAITEKFSAKNRQQTRTHTFNSLGMPTKGIGNIAQIDGQLSTCVWTSEI